MKRFVTMVALATFVAVPGAMAQSVDGGFGWTISNSTTDPYSNSGAPEQGYTGGNLYLWLACASLDLLPPDDGWSAADLGFDLIPGPDGVFPVSFGDLSGSAVANPYPDLQLGAPAGCPVTPMLVGLLALPADPGLKVQNFAICFRAYAGPASAGISRTADCPSNGGRAHEISWIGFNRGSVGGCVSAHPTICPSSAVAEESWGSVKSLYR